jgi:hypothetical protein
VPDAIVYLMAALIQNTLLSGCADNDVAGSAVEGDLISYGATINGIKIVKTVTIDTAGGSVYDIRTRDYEISGDTVVIGG